MEKPIPEKPVPADDSEELESPLVAEPISELEEALQEVLQGATASFTRPAKCDFDSAAVDLFARSSEDNNLGTPRPSKVLFGLDKTRKYLLGIPIGPETRGGTKIHYRAGRAQATLTRLFKLLDRVVQKGVRERYPVRRTQSEITIGKVKGWGISIKLSEGTKEPIQQLSEEERAARLAKLRQTLAAKKARKESAATDEEAAE